MKNKEHLQESLSILFARLMSSEEGRWVVVTRTKGKNKSGQRWLIKELTKMAQLLKIDVESMTEPDFRIMKIKEYVPFSQRYAHLIPNKHFRVQQLPRQAGKTAITKEILDEMRAFGTKVLSIPPKP